MGDPSHRNQLLITIQSLGILVIGSCVVIVLAILKTIQDGETIALFSAVLSAAMGTHALNRKPNLTDD